MTWNREHVLNSEEKLSDFSPVLSHIPVQPLPVCQRFITDRSRKAVRPSGNVLPAVLDSRYMK